MSVIFRRRVVLRILATSECGMVISLMRVRMSSVEGRKGGVEVHAECFVVGVEGIAEDGRVSTPSIGLGRSMAEGT